ncbi:hypothetical protein BDA96_04G011900 [Sorghum bicolor]|uniref:F-box domain-containing protein n=1 Tax=Sorghum bicolor TaxID=4558 RepID=A0A921R0U5_SORBI|nr:hypothetical protein BDA96_04G011900 [Sorghum bicolor]
MGKPKLEAFRLLRSCLCFSGQKRDKEEAEATGDVKLGLGGGGDQHPDAEPPQLPEDIIFDVLSRLPVKTLCRFRCVSKSWRALISSPAFASAQASRAAAPLVAGVFGPPCPINKFHPARAPRFLPEPSVEVRVMDPADGGSVLRVVKDVKSTKMMCSARLGRLVLVDQGDRGASVIDPATGRVMVLDGESSSTSATTLSLYTAAAGDGDDIDNTVFACRWSSYNSLGRATPSGAYKVVRLRDSLATNKGFVQICHVATVPWPWPWDDDDDHQGRGRGGGINIAMDCCCWRRRPEPPILTCGCSSCTAVVDGVLYLMNHRCPSHTGRPWSPPISMCHVSIASFDLESEEWKPTIISGPSSASPLNKDVGWEMALAPLKGSLCLIQTDIIRNNNNNNNHHPGSRCYCTKNIWFLVDSERSIWVKEYAIQMTEGWCLFKPLEILVDGRILMLNAFKKKEQKLSDDDVQCVLQLYHPTTGALTHLMEMGNDFRGPLTLYTGSLLTME